jgi:ubiquinone/menaquinone biosynthesis C-methylase UbiE
MSKYLETIYFRNEIGENDYPQKLCNHLFHNIICKNGTFGPQLLDVGCGRGAHILGFSRLGMIPKGIDKRKGQAASFEVKMCDIETDDFPYDDNSFHFVFSKSVIEHVNNVDHVFEEIHRVLKVDGLAIIMTPDWDSSHRCFWDDYTHVKPWTRKSLQNAMRIHNFKLVQCMFFRQLPILWRFPFLKIICDVVSLFPNSWKWKDADEEHFRTFIRFSKEKMLLATGKK